MRDLNFDTIITYQNRVESSARSRYHYTSMIHFLISLLKVLREIWIYHPYLIYSGFGELSMNKCVHQGIVREINLDERAFERQHTHNEQSFCTLDKKQNEVCIFCCSCQATVGLSDVQNNLVGIIPIFNMLKVYIHECFSWDRNN